MSTPEHDLSTSDIVAGTSAEARDDQPRPSDDQPRPSDDQPRPSDDQPAARTDDGRGQSERALFEDADSERMQRQWESVQAAFVDDPRQAVEQADALVAEAIRRLAELFSDERSRLEGQWDRGEEVSTEDMRLALQRYRSFFNRLLRV